MTGSRLFIATALLVFAASLLAACSQNPSAEGVDASAAKQANAEQPSDEPTLIEETTPMPEATMMTTVEDVASLVSGANPPKYEVRNNGTLIIEGDMLVRCADLNRSYWEGENLTPEARRQMRRDHKEQIAVCTKAGFPPDKTPQSP